MHAQLDFLASRAARLTATRARLEAERDGAADLQLPPTFTASHPSANAFGASERLALSLRRAATRNQKSMLEQRLRQAQDEADALTAQHAARERELKLLREELELIGNMYGRELTTVDRLMSLRRSVARSEGDVAELLAQIARAKSQITEAELRTVEIDQKVTLDASQEIREIDVQLDELAQRRVTIGAELARPDVIAEEPARALLGNDPGAR